MLNISLAEVPALLTSLRSLNLSQEKTAHFKHIITSKSCESQVQKKITLIDSLLPSAAVISARSHSHSALT